MMNLCPRDTRRAEVVDVYATCPMPQIQLRLKWFARSQELHPTTRILAIDPQCTDELKKYMHYDSAASKAMGVFPSPSRFQLASALGHDESGSSGSDFSLFSILNKTCTAMGSRMLKGCGVKSLSADGMLLLYNEGATLRYELMPATCTTAISWACLCNVVQLENRSSMWSLLPVRLSWQVVTTPSCGYSRDQPAPDDDRNLVRNEGIA